jgi:hypothetical protein
MDDLKWMLGVEWVVVVEEQVNLQTLVLVRLNLHLLIP